MKYPTYNYTVNPNLINGHLRPVTPYTDEELRRINNAEVCPYCWRSPRLVDSSEVYYGRSYGWVWLCRCGAYVGCHKGTQEALGRVADHNLRFWREKAHAAFDPLWRRKMLRSGISKADARKAAYAWLSEVMGTLPEYTHIAMFDMIQCRRVVELCEPYLYKKSG